MLFLYWKLIFGNQNILNSLSRATSNKKKKKKKTKETEKNEQWLIWNTLKQKPLPWEGLGARGGG